MYRTADLTPSPRAAPQARPRQRRGRLGFAAALLLSLMVAIDILALKPVAAGIARSPAVPYLVLLGLGALAALMLRALTATGLAARLSPVPRRAQQRPFPVCLTTPWERLALSPLRRAAFVLLMLLVERATRAASLQLWPGSSPWPIWILPIGLFYLLAPVLSRIWARLLSLQKAERPVWRELRWAADTLIYWAGAGLLSMWLFDWLVPLTAQLPTLLRQGVLMVLAGVALIDLAILVHWLLNPLLRIDRALRRAGYEAALNELQRPEGLLTPANLLERRGVVHFWQGRLQEAEQCLRRSLEQGQDDPLFAPAVALDHLGSVLMEQEQFTDAMQAFSTAIEVDPRRAHPYCGQAEVYLRQAIQAPRALKLVRWSLERSRRSLLGRLLHGRELGEMWANQAQALTQMSCPAEADEALEAAFREVDARFKPGLAGLHYRAGLAMALRDLLIAAEAHFNRAAQADPRGLYGRLAADAARQVSEAIVAGAGRQPAYNLVGISSEDLLGSYSEGGSPMRRATARLREWADLVRHWLQL